MQRIWSQALFIIFFQQVSGNFEVQLQVALKGIAPHQHHSFSQEVDGLTLAHFRKFVAADIQNFELHHTLAHLLLGAVFQVGERTLDLLDSIIADYQDFETAHLLRLQKFLKAGVGEFAASEVQVLEVAQVR